MTRHLREAFAFRRAALAAVAWLALLTTSRMLWSQAAAVAPALEDLVAIQAGDLPILLSAPHGGTQEIPEIPPRVGDGLPRGGAGFVTSRDTGTEELALEIAAEIERRFRKKPYFVMSRAHRRYLDPNRPPHIAYQHAGAKPVYDRYHDSLAKFCGDALNRFGRGLLLDVHGQGSRADTLFRGTKNGLTVTLLRERYGDEAHAGPDSLFGLLKLRNWTVHPDPGDGAEQSGYTGGYIVQTYGSHQMYAIDAIQLEFGRDYRSAQARKDTARVLVDALVDYAARYLDIEAAAVAPEVRQSASPSTVPRKPKTISPSAPAAYVKTRKLPPYR